MSATRHPLQAKAEPWQSAVQREMVVRPLAQKPDLCPEEMKAACAKLGVSKAFLYRLLSRYRNDPRTSALLPRKRGRPVGTSQLNANAEAIVDCGIERWYLTRQKLSISKLERMIGIEASKAGIPKPSRKAIERRIARIGARRLVGAREGHEAARVKTQPVIGQFLATRPLEIVQVDHTRVDVFVVDEEHRLPIQRPWLTLMIDVASRMVMGYYLTLEAPSSTSVALTLQHAVLPKEQWLADLGITAPWPVHGLPETLHMDNGKEFHAKALRRGADEYGIHLQYRPVKTPHYGGHIERLIGTMMGEVHLLPGTTFSNIAQRGSYDSERHATMTLRELNHWLAIQVVGQYHQAIHRTLGRPPLAVWNELTAGSAALRLPEDQKRFYCDFLPYAERRIGRDGIHLFNIRYWDNVLSCWSGRSRDDFVVRYDPRNLSTVFVQSPEGEFWPVRYANLGMPPVALWEWKAARKRLREQGRREYDERVVFDTVESKRLLLEEAVLKTKTARRQHQRVAEALRPVDTKLPSRVQQTRVLTVPTKEETFEPYEIEEWS
ncbi:MAG: transposase [Candidatus Melainabacteria bacterium]|nr:MAG: transposase [Candidatus Melainabacteria bacterium]